MKRLFTIISLIAAVFMAGCSHDEYVPDGSFSVKAGISQTETKAGATEAQLLAGAKINLYYADFSGLVRSYKYSELPEVIWLPGNSYRVDVIAGEAAKDSPTKASCVNRQRAWRLNSRMEDSSHCGCGRSNSAHISSRAWKTLCVRGSSVVSSTT